MTIPNDGTDPCGWVGQQFLLLKHGSQKHYDRRGIGVLCSTPPLLKLVQRAIERRSGPEALAWPGRIATWETFAHHLWLVGHRNNVTADYQTGPWMERLLIDAEVPTGLPDEEPQPHGRWVENYVRVAFRDVLLCDEWNHPLHEMLEMWDIRCHRVSWGLIKGES